MAKNGEQWGKSGGKWGKLGKSCEKLLKVAKSGKKLRKVTRCGYMLFYVANTDTQTNKLNTIPLLCKINMWFCVARSG